jgi:hypothetical protein
MERTLQSPKTPDSRETHISGSFVVGAAEAVGTQSPPASQAGFLVTKVAAKVGRYKLKFQKGAYKRLKSITATYIGPDDTAPANTTGESGTPLFRFNTTKLDGSILFQGRQGASGADAAITTGTVVMFHAIFSDE